MDGKKIKVQAIINPISGVGSKRKIPKMIERMCETGGCPLEISFTEYPGHASELTRKAIDEGANCIIAVGGDGTVNEIARAMVHSCLLYTSFFRKGLSLLQRCILVPMDIRCV